MPVDVSGGMGQVGGLARRRRLTGIILVCLAFLFPSSVGCSTPSEGNPEPSAKPLLVKVGPGCASVKSCAGYQNISRHRQIEFVCPATCWFGTWI